MFDREHFARGNLSLDELIALNDEIASLIRAGVPLDAGLRSWSADTPGALGQTAGQMADAIHQGKCLADVLDESGQAMPAVYKAIVKAGLKSGRLPAALESMASSARHLRELRGAIGLAVLYPLILILLPYALFALLVSRFFSALEQLHEGNSPWVWNILAQGASLAQTRWAIIPPAVLIVLVLLWWHRTRSALVVDGGRVGRWLFWMPIAKGIMRNSKAASFAEVLGLLVEHDVPLHEGLVLAADCTADPRLAKSARVLAADLQAGAVIRADNRALGDFPPQLRALLTSSRRKETWTAMARHLGDTYRRRIALDSQWLRDYLPVWLVLIAGGLVVGAYALTIFLPYAELMEMLSGDLKHGMRIRP